MTAPVDEPGGAEARAIVDGSRLWTGGVATALVVALIVLVGVLIGRGVGMPRLAGDRTGTLATGSVASYAARLRGAGRRPRQRASVPGRRLN